MGPRVAPTLPSKGALPSALGSDPAVEAREHEKFRSRRRAHHQPAGSPERAGGFGPLSELLTGIELFQIFLLQDHLQMPELNLIMLQWEYLYLFKHPNLQLADQAGLPFPVRF